MTDESKIIAGVIALLEAETDDPAFEFGSPDSVTDGAQFVVQCDRPAVADRDRRGRPVELSYTLVIHSIIHSQKMREDETKKDEMIEIADAVIRALSLDDVDGWIDGSCTGIHEQDGQYNFNEAFDDFATVAELFVAT